MSGAIASKRGAAADMNKPSIDIATELVRLEALALFEVKGEWRRLHRWPPPKRMSRHLLMRGITDRLQERRLGGLSPAIIRKLERLKAGRLFGAVSAGAGAAGWRDDQARLGEALHRAARRRGILQVVQSWDTAIEGRSGQRLVRLHDVAANYGLPVVSGGRMAPAR